jgi:hypothetical protein
MDKYEKFIKDVEKNTRAGEIKWSIASREAYAEYMFNSRFVFQTYEADYTKDEDTYHLVLVERKDPITDEWEEVHERYSIMVLVFKHGKFIFTLTEGHVDQSDLARLVSCVEDKNEDAAELFDKFE